MPELLFRVVVLVLNDVAPSGLSDRRWILIFKAAGTPEVIGHS